MRGHISMTLHAPGQPQKFGSPHSGHPHGCLWLRHKPSDSTGSLQFSSSNSKSNYSQFPAEGNKSSPTQASFDSRSSSFSSSSQFEVSSRTPKRKCCFGNLKCHFYKLPNKNTKLLVKENNRAFVSFLCRCIFQQAVPQLHFHKK